MANSENSANSSCSLEYFELPNNKVFWFVNGAVAIKKDLTRNDVLGFFPLPFEIDTSVSFFGYEDDVSNMDSQVMVVVTLLEDGKLKTRGPLTSAVWIGFSGSGIATKKL